MQITAQLVSQLREQTGVGMMECKKALTQTDGDIEKARDFLRAVGKAGAEKRSGRAAADGVVTVAENESGIALIELNSETDFVARNDEFIALAATLAQLALTSSGNTVDEILAETTPDGSSGRAKLDDIIAKLRENIVFRRFARVPKGNGIVSASYIHLVTNKIGVLVELAVEGDQPAALDTAKGIAMHVAAVKPSFLTAADVPEDVVAREKEVLTEKTRNEGKPEAAIAKIVEGRIGKFFEQSCLVQQPYVRDPSKTIAQLAKECGAVVTRFVLFQVGQN